MGDGECDISCMTVDCSYDSGTASISDSDCLDKCLVDGCTIDLLINDVCNEECDTPECGYDNGLCGYCASGCFKDMILNSNKDEACNSRSCYYDASEYSQCSPGCDSKKLTDSKCNEECNTSLCNFDFGSCEGIITEFDSGCLSIYLGNGICNEECNEKEFSYDDMDCLCAEECTPKLQNGDNCEEVCNTEACSPESCQCPLKCQDSPGDGVCDLDCWNEACNYIDSDCGCSYNCRFDEISTCKPECLVYNCNFGQLQDYEFCDDQLLIDLSRSHQFIQGNFSSTISINDCSNGSFEMFGESCTYDLLKNDPCYANEDGDILCYIEDCAYGLGKCIENCEDKCGLEKACYKSQEDTNEILCLKCSGKVQFFNICIEECPFGYETKDGNNLCEPLEDTSSEEQPYEYFIKNGLNETISGSSFSSLSIALASIYSKYSIIYLEPEEDHYLEKLPENLSATHEKSRHPMTRSNFKPSRITIKGDSSYISIVSEHFVVFDITHGVLEIEGVEFRTLKLNENCETDCDFCPLNCIAEVCTTDCSFFEEENFINVYSSLILKDVKFKNMRNDFNSLINVDGGNLTMENVQFEKVKARTSLTSGIIICNNEASLTYKNGSLRQLNDGYELELRKSHYYDFSGFLYLESVASVIIENVDFHYNVVYKQSLIRALDSQKISIENCVFSNNILKEGLLDVDKPNVPEYSILENSNNTIYETYYNHVYIADCVFKNNWIESIGLIHVHFKDFVQNVYLENLEFEDNLHEESSIIELENISEQKPLKDFHKKYVDSRRILGYFVERSISMNNISIKNSCIWSAPGISIFEVPIVNISNLEISKVSSKSLNIYEFIVDDFIEQTDSTRGADYIAASDDLFSIIDMSEIVKIDISGIKMHDIELSNGNVLQIASSKTLNIEDAEIYGFDLESSLGIVHIDSVEETSVKNSRFYDNHNLNTLGTAVFYATGELEESIGFENCKFSDNEGGNGSCIFASINTVTVDNCEFIKNEGLYTAGAAIAVSSKLESSGLMISNSEFTGNRLTLGPGSSIYISKETESKVNFHLDIRNCNFKENSGSSLGSVISLQENVKLHKDSIIFNSSFIENKGTDGIIGILSIGALEIEECEFEKNEGETSSAIMHSGKEDFVLKLKKSRFVNNRGSYVIFLDDYSVYNHMSTKSCTFERNQGSPIALTFAEWSDDGSSFLYNEFLSEGGKGILLSSSSQAELTNTEFKYNQAVYGPGIFVMTLSKLSCVNCDFSHNLAMISGGAVFVEHASISISQSVVFNNTARSGYGGGIFISNSVEEMNNVTDTEVYRNESKEGHEISAILSGLQLDNVTVHDNTSANNFTGVIVNMGVLNIYNSKFHSQKSLTSPLISGTLSNVVIENSEFYNSSSTFMNGGVSFLSCEGEIKNTRFYDITSEELGAVYISSVSDFNVSSSSFSNIITNSNGLISVFDSSLYVKDSNFSDYRGKGIDAVDCINFEVQGSVFKNGQAENGAGVRASSTLSVKITDSTFDNLFVEDAGAGVFVDSISKNSLVIKNSVFYQNNATLGAGVYSKSTNLQLTENVFVQNLATTDSKEEKDLATKSEGIGGAILLKCNSECDHNVSHNSFRENFATYNGGGIYWSDVRPVLENNIYMNNQAQYGPDFASFPVRLAEIDEEGNVMPYRRRLEEVPVGGSFEEVPPGQTVEDYIVIGLIDHYGQVVSTDNASIAALVLDDSEETSSGDPEIAGSTIFNAANGTFNLTEFKVIAEPESHVSLFFTTEAVKVLDDDTFYSEEIMITISLRKCEVGEINSRNECVICPVDYYSLNPEDKECKKCPNGAKCQGSDDIFPLDGHWRSSNTSDVFWACPYTYACKGYSTNNKSSTGSCAQGYTGNKCQSCDIGYSRSSPNRCGKCPDKEWDGLKVIGILILLLIVVVFIIRSSFQAAHRLNSKHSIYFKIFVNYLQLVLLTSTFNLSWPDYVVTLFSVQQAAGSATDQIFSIDCFLDDENSVYFIKVLLMSLLPFIIILCCLSIWGIVSIIKKTNEYLKVELVATVIVLMFLIHPNILRVMFGAINCTEINKDEYWLVEDLDIPCWDTTHSFYAIVIAIPSIILWGVAIPVLVLYLLYKNKKKLHYLDTRKTYGFLYNGYKQSEYYWEIVILIRKLFVLCCAVILNTVSIPIQALSILLVLIGCLYLQYRNKPFAYEELNRVELQAILVAACTIYCGLYYLVEDISEEFKLFLFFVIVFSNVYFVFIWTKGLFDIGVKKIKSMLSRNGTGIPDLDEAPNARNNPLFANDKIYSLKSDFQHLPNAIYSRPKVDRKMQMKHLFMQVVETEIEAINTLQPILEIEEIDSSPTTPMFNSRGQIRT